MYSRKKTDGPIEFNELNKTAVLIRNFIGIKVQI